MHPALLATPSLLTLPLPGLMGCVLSNTAEAKGKAAAGTYPSESVPSGHSTDYHADGSGGHHSGNTTAAGGSGGPGDGGGGGKFDWASSSDGRTSNVYDVAASAAVTSASTATTSPASQVFPQKAAGDASRANAKSSPRTAVGPAAGGAAAGAPNPFAPMAAVFKPAGRLSGVALAVHGGAPAATSNGKAHAALSQLSPTKVGSSSNGGAHGSHAPPLHSPMRLHPHGPNPRASMSASAELHRTRESLLSDISDTLSSLSSTMHSSQDCSSPSYGNAGEGRNSVVNALFRTGDDLEAQRQQAPLSIEEDLFIYDDIVISKDEARTKHWRLAGRKPPPVAIDGAGGDAGPSGGAGGAGGGAGAGVGGKKFFSFNDFDVCVDEMDLMPLTAAAAAGVAALQREALAEVSRSGLKCMTVTNTACKAPNTVAYLTSQARATQPKVNRPLRGFQATPLLGHANRVKCIALSPAETDFASCSNEDASITLNNLGVGSEVGIFTGHQDTIINATFSPDGKYLATTSKDKTMILWDVMTTKNLLTFSHPKVVICCCFGPDSKYLVSGCQDRVCRLWDTKRGREWLSYTGHEGIIIAIAFSPDGNYVCSASADKSLRVWSATTAKTRFHLLGHLGIILSCSYTSDGRHIISNDESLLRVWSAEDGSCKLSLSPADVAGAAPPQHRGPKLGWTLSSAAPGAFTRFLLVACNNRFVYVLDIETGREVTSAFCKAPVYCLTAGSYEKMACGDSFGNIYILSLK